MPGKSVIVPALLVLISCSDEGPQNGLYDYQVERLLTNGSSKTWNEVVNTSNCQDSTRLLFELLTNTTDDSVTIYQLIPRSDCSRFDTTLLGNADASSFEQGIRFSDSLIFANGDFWMVEQITSDLLTLRISETSSYRANN